MSQEHSLSNLTHLDPQALTSDRLQHWVWLSSKPEFWLVIAKWILVFAGVIVIAFKLFWARYFAWLCIFLIVVIVSALGVYELSQQAVQLFREGRGNEIGLLRVVAVVTDVFALLVLVEVFRETFFRTKSSK